MLIYSRADDDLLDGESYSSPVREPYGARTPPGRYDAVDAPLRGRLNGTPERELRPSHVSQLMCTTRGAGYAFLLPWWLVADSHRRHFPCLRCLYAFTLHFPELPCTRRTPNENPQRGVDVRKGF